ncbi:hypothetical protein [Halioxenophilus sp. WMMB6]|uniref:hypothetical protein n=1 Tax=Halioxenophilus sp. WMMB6 TaxID=3073815 RepID=UPI00295E49CB|nr:hypothetical protein [Halioxenophilus sp. WMMB6]
MIKKLFTADLYIKISINKFLIKNLSTGDDWITEHPAQPFTNDRLLVANFSVAEPVLRNLLKSCIGGMLLKKQARVLIQPLALVDGGLSEVEEKVLRELGLAAGAYKVVLHVGDELSNEQAQARLEKG